MNYEPNEQHWRKGDIVLHDADAKEPKMLMRVIGYTRDGLCKTQYVDQSIRHRRREVFENDLKYLHDAAGWGLCEQSRQDEWERVRLWNYNYAIGTRVRIVEDITGKVIETVTRTDAQYVKGVYAWIWLEGVVGAWVLSHVEALEPPNNPNRYGATTADRQRSDSRGGESRDAGEGGAT